MKTKKKRYFDGGVENQQYDQGPLEMDTLDIGASIPDFSEAADNRTEEEKMTEDEEVDAMLESELQEESLKEEAELPITDYAKEDFEMSQDIKKDKKPSSPESKEDRYLKLLKELEGDYFGKKKKDNNQVMNWLSAVGQVSDVYNEMSRDPHAPKSKVQYWEDVQEAARQKKRKEDLENLKYLQSAYKAQKGEGMTEYQKRYLSFLNKNLDKKDQIQDYISERQKRSFEQKDIDRKLKAKGKIYDVTEDYEGNKVVQQLNEQGLSFSQASDLLSQVEKGNEVALSAMGTKMARAMGEVGVLTDADVVRYIESQSLLRKGKDYWARRGKGKLYDQTLKDLKGIIQKMRKGFEKEKVTLYDKYVKKAWENYGEESGLTLEQVEKRFGMPSMAKMRQKKQSTKSDTQEVRRKTKDGRVAIFDANTKKFIRYED